MKTVLARASGAMLSLDAVDKVFSFLDPDFQAKAGPDFRASRGVIVETLREKGGGPKPLPVAA